MIGLYVKFNIVAGKEAEFEKVMSDLAAQVRKNEPGNKLYTLGKDKDGKYSMMELYTSKEALAAHSKTDHFKTFGAKFAGVMAGAPDIQNFEIIA